MTDQTDTPEVPLTTRLLMSASALNLLANSDVRRLQPGLVAEEPALLKSLPGLLAQAASVIHGKQALLIRLMDAYAAGDGEGTATLEAIESAIKRGAGADPDLQACKTDAERALGATAGSAVEAVSLLATEHLNLQRELATARMTSQCLAYPGRDTEGNLLGSEPACTGITASWCPRCGDCKCPPLRKEVGDMDAPGCPLHALDSAHGEDPDVGALQEEATREAASKAAFRAKIEAKALADMTADGGPAELASDDGSIRGRMRLVLENFNLASAEKLLCEEALATAGSIVEAAQLLGCTRHRLKRLIIAHHIMWPKSRTVVVPAPREETDHG